MVRTMAMEFEADENCRYLDKQYLLGDSLLVAPIFNAEGLAHYYLPAGCEWVNFFTGERVTGGVWRKEKHGYCSVPLWVRGGSILPTAIEAPDADVRFPGNLEFRVYALTDNARTEAYQDGAVVASIALHMKDGAASVEADAPGCRVRFIGQKHMTVSGRETCPDGEDGIVML